MTDDSDFQKYRPAITEVDVVNAAKSWAEGDGILSLAGRRTAIDAFIFVLATDLETKGPFLLNAKCASELCNLLIAEGFGPTK